VLTDASLLDAIHQNISLAARRVVHKNVRGAAMEILEGWLLIDAGRGAMPWLNSTTPAREQNYQIRQ
jgi:hypothetical protein